MCRCILDVFLSFFFRPAVPAALSSILSGEPRNASLRQIKTRFENLPKNVGVFNQKKRTARISLARRSENSHLSYQQLSKRPARIW